MLKPVGTVVPDKAIVTDGSEALLVIVYAAAEVPRRRMALSSRSAPRGRRQPDRAQEAPSILNPAPESVTFEMETLELPEFVSVTGKVLLLPVITFP